ncbi:cytochrome-c peroxidase [Archangium violaceum]|uniref:cytochrome-c peroxidase n=1 Tax=Archangium violaceum TaxID=83451 RepID=UPI00193C6D20|nr:cytochrome-c peroxidase [Archangium violaceum]QRK08326.1 cytochrome-c peroxidase [Archangium violaceum]
MKFNSLVRPLFLVAVTAGTAAFAQAAKPTAAAPAAPTTAAQNVVIDRALLKAFKVLPTRFEDPKNPITPEKVELGRMLYFDTRLSKNQDVSCNSCHDLNKFGVDGKPFSTGHKKQLGGRNSPTVYNSGGHLLQFWDGRAANLEEQAKGPILNPVEMAMPSEERVVETVKSIPGYVTAFQKAFPGEADPVTYDNLAKAIGAFERQLVTPSRFDKFLAGDDKALSAAEKVGLQKFLEQGCQTCHNGPAIGGSMQKLGLVVPFQSKDQGRFDLTKKESDRMMFRVPTLRNVTKTAPYFHDGSVKELQTAVKLMAQHQFGKQISDADAKSIVTFLDSLTGELPKSYIARPKLPASGPKTPKPDPS